MMSSSYAFIEFYSSFSFPSSFIANIILSQMELKRTIYKLSVYSSDSNYLINFMIKQKFNMSDIHNAYILL